jgi:trans-aconitate methyltransferase
LDAATGGAGGVDDEAELDRLLDEQTRYYRARAATYDLDMAWDSDDPELRELFAPVEAWFAELPVRGQVLELACGTGAWTRRLARRAEHVHAVDVAPEMIERARGRVAGVGSVSFELADVHAWEPPRRYDVVHVAFLLSHIPSARWDRFWDVATAAVADDGILAFVDAAPDRRDEEEWLTEGVVRRRLRDGSEHRIVKVFPTPAELTAALTSRGLEVEVSVLGDHFLVGTARRSRPDG